MESKPQNTVLKVTSDHDLSDIIVGTIRGHRGTKGCTLREIHKFVQVDYTIETAENHDLLRHLIVSCKKLIKNGRLFKHGCKFRVSYNELAQDHLSDSSLSPLKDPSSVSKTSVYVCELCKENDEGKKSSEISVNSTKDGSHSESLLSANPPDKCFRCLSYSSCSVEDDRSSVNLTSPDRSFNCDGDDDGEVNGSNSAPSLLDVSSSISASDSNKLASEPGHISGEARSIVPGDGRQHSSVTVHRVSDPVADCDHLKGLSSDDKTDDGLKSTDATDGSTKQDETNRIRKTRNRRTQVKFLTDGLTQFYSSEGKRKRPANVAGCDSSGTPTAKKPRTSVDGEKSETELTLNQNNPRTPQGRCRSTDSVVETDVRQPKKKYVFSPGSHGTYQLLTGIKEDVLFPHITEEDVNMFESARSTAAQRLLQKLCSMTTALPFEPESASVKTPSRQNWTPTILLPSDDLMRENDASSKHLDAETVSVETCHLPANKSLDLLETPQPASSTEGGKIDKNEGDEASFSGFDDGGDEEFSDDDNVGTGLNVGIEENASLDIARGDILRGSNDAEPVLAVAVDVTTDSGESFHRGEETTECSNGGRTNDNPAADNKPERIIIFADEKFEDADSSDFGKINNDESNAVGTEIAIIGTIDFDTSLGRETGVAVFEKNEATCLDVSALIVVENSAQNATSIEEFGITDAKRSPVYGCDAAALNTSVTTGIANTGINDGIDLSGIVSSGAENWCADRKDEGTTNVFGETGSGSENGEVMTASCKLACEILCANGRITRFTDTDEVCSEGAISGVDVDRQNVKLTPNRQDESSASLQLISGSAAEFGIESSDVSGYVTGDAANVGNSAVSDSASNSTVDSIIISNESLRRHESYVGEMSICMTRQFVDEKTTIGHDVPFVASTEKSVVTTQHDGSETEKSVASESLLATSGEASAGFCNDAELLQVAAEGRVDTDVPTDKMETEVQADTLASRDHLALNTDQCFDSLMMDLNWASNQDNAPDRNSFQAIESSYLESQGNECDTCIEGLVCDRSSPNAIFLLTEAQQSQTKMETRALSDNELFPSQNPRNDAAERPEGSNERSVDESLPSKRNRKRKRMFCLDGCCANNSDGHCKVMKIDDTSPKVKNGSEAKQRPSTQQSEPPKRRGRPRKNKGNTSVELNNSVLGVSASGPSDLFETLEASGIFNIDAKSPTAPAADLVSSGVRGAAETEESGMPTCGYATIASDALNTLGPLVSHKTPSPPEDVVDRKHAVVENCDSAPEDASCGALDDADLSVIKSSGDEETTACGQFLSDSDALTKSEVSDSVETAVCCSATAVSIPTSSGSLTSQETSVLNEVVSNFDGLSPPPIKDSSCSRSNSVFGNVLMDQWNGLEEMVVHERTRFGVDDRGLAVNRDGSLVDEDDAKLLDSGAQDVASYQDGEAGTSRVTSCNGNSWVASNEMSSNECSIAGGDIVTALVDVFSSHSPKLDGGITDDIGDQNDVNLPQIGALDLPNCGDMVDAHSSGVCSKCLVVNCSEPQSVTVHFGELERKSPLPSQDYGAPLAAETNVQGNLNKDELIGLMKLNDLLPNESEKNDFVIAAERHDCHIADLNAVPNFNSAELGICENRSSDNRQLAASAAMMQECYVPFDSLSADCQVQIPTDFQLQGSERPIQLTILPPDNHIQVPANSSQMLLQLVDPNVRDCQVPVGSLNSDVFMASSCHQVPAAGPFDNGISNMQNGSFVNNDVPAVPTQNHLNAASFLNASCVNAVPVASAANASNLVGNNFQESLLNAQLSNLMYALPLQNAMLVNPPSNMMYALPVQSVVAGVNFETVDATDAANRNLCGKPDNLQAAGVNAQCPVHSYGNRGALMSQLLGCQPYIIICPGTLPLSSILQPLNDTLTQLHSCSPMAPRHQTCHASMMGNLVAPVQQYVWGMPPQNISPQNVISVAKTPAEMSSGGEMFVSAAEHQSHNRCNVPSASNIDVCNGAYGTQTLNSVDAARFVSENLVAQQFVAAQNLSLQLGQMADTSAVTIQVQTYSPGK